jgi:hypothetical protein
MRRQSTGQCPGDTAAHANAMHAAEQADDERGEEVELLGKHPGRRRFRFLARATSLTL